jgi:hypothetical protein
MHLITGPRRKPWHVRGWLNQLELRCRVALRGRSRTSIAVLLTFIGFCSIKLALYDSGNLVISTGDAAGSSYRRLGLDFWRGSYDEDAGENEVLRSKGTKTASRGVLEGDSCRYVKGDEAQRARLQLRGRGPAQTDIDAGEVFAGFDFRVSHQDFIYSVPF